MNDQFSFKTLYREIGISEKYRQIASICFFVMVGLVVARAPFWINPGWSVDAYSISVHGQSTQQLLAQGRFGQYLLYLILPTFGIDRVSDASTLQLLGLLLTGVFTPLLLTSFIDIKHLPVFGAVACSLIFLLHPYQAEILTFSEASFSVSLGFALGVGGFLLALNGGKRNILIGASLLVLALSIYQIVLAYVVLALAFGIFIGRTKSTIGSGEKHFNSESKIKRIKNGAACIALAVATYFFLLIVVRLLFHTPLDQRASFLSISKIPGRLESFINLLAKQSTFPLIVSASSASTFLGLVTSFSAGLWASRRKKGYLSLAAFALTGTIAATGLILVGSTWWPVPRVLCGFPLLMTFILLGAWVSNCTKRINNILQISSLILIISFTSIGNNIHWDQLRMNRWDQAMADDIYHRAETMVPPDGKPPTLSIVNSKMRWAYPVPLATTEGDLNISAFYVPSSLQGLFIESTGRQIALSSPSDSDIEFCKSAPKWPERGSSRYEDGIAKFCI